MKNITQFLSENPKVALNNGFQFNDFATGLIEGFGKSTRIVGIIVYNEEKACFCIKGMILSNEDEIKCFPLHEVKNLERLVTLDMLP